MNTNNAQWLFDLPEQVQGVEPVIQDMAQKTVNNIAAKYPALSNWQVRADPNQIYVSADAPTNLDMSAVIAFGQEIWRQCCTWKLGELGA